MKGLGTIINVAFIMIGGLLGSLFGNRLPERYQDTIMKANGVAVLFIGISGAMAQMLTIHDMSLETQGTMMMTVSLSLGAIIGERLYFLCDSGWYFSRIDYIVCRFFSTCDYRCCDSISIPCRFYPDFLRRNQSSLGENNKGDQLAAGTCDCSSVELLLNMLMQQQKI